MEHDSRQAGVLEFLGISRERIDAEYRTLVHLVNKGTVYGLSLDEMAERLQFRREDLERFIAGDS